MFAANFNIIKIMTIPFNRRVMKLKDENGQILKIYFIDFGPELDEIIFLK